MTKFCNKCNYPIEEGGAFCSECGSSDIRDSSAPQEISEMDEEKKDNGTIENKPLGTGVVMPVSNTQEEGIPEIVPMEPSNSISNDDKIRDAIKNTHDIFPEKNGAKEETPMMSVPSDNAPSENVLGHGSHPADIPKGFRPDEDEEEENLSKPIDENIDLSVGGNTSIAQKRQMAQKKRGGSKLLIAGLGIGFCAIVGFLLIFVFYYGKAVASIEGSAVVDGPFKVEDLRSAGTTTPTVDYSTIFTPENSFRVGDQNYGYFSIPNTWVKFADVNENKTLQFTDNGTWIVTMYAVPTNQLSAVNWANNVYTNLNKEQVKNITTSISNINTYPALTISAYYETQGKYLTTWFFESKSGKTHYLAIEGPSNTGDNYNIIYSFRDDQ